MAVTDFATDSGMQVSHYGHLLHDEMLAEQR